MNLIQDHGLAPAPIALLTTESEARLEVLRRALGRAGGFGLFVIFASDAARYEVLRRLHAWRGTRGIPELYVFPDGDELGPAVDHFLAVEDRANPLPGAVFPDGSALLDVAKGETLATLNMSRDILNKLIRGPLVLILPAARALDFARRASDLYDVRALTVEVNALPSEPGGASEDLAESSASDAQERVPGEPRPLPTIQADAARLRELARSAEPFPRGALADAWIRLGRELLSAGALEEGMAAAREAKQLAESIGYDAGVASALFLEGDVLGREGRIEERTLLLRRALDLFRPLGDTRAVARVLVALSDVLSRTGLVNEAERMLREAEGLFGSWGYARERAVALGKLAELAFAHERFDEALRIRRQEQLPIYRKLGDHRECAATLNRIADIMHARGQLDEALRIRQSEVQRGAGLVSS
jgi:tetratricopeptide (TPR) repeat protein